MQMTLHYGHQNYHLRRRIAMSKSITSQLSDEAIYQILEIIASEIDDIDDKELSITFED